MSFSMGRGPTLTSFLGLDVSLFTSGMKQAEKSVGAFGATLAKTSFQETVSGFNAVNQSAGNMISTIGRSLERVVSYGIILKGFSLAVAPVTQALAGLKDQIDMSVEISNVVSVTGGAIATLDRLGDAFVGPQDQIAMARKQYRDFSDDISNIATSSGVYVKNINDITDAMYELAGAGVGLTNAPGGGQIFTREVLANAAKTATLVAGATHGGVGPAAGVLTTGALTYAQRGTTIQEIGDLFAEYTRVGRGDPNAFASAYQRGIGELGAFGLNPNEAFASISALTLAGYSPLEAGVSARSLVRGIADPSQQAAKLDRELAQKAVARGQTGAQPLLTGGALAKQGLGGWLSTVQQRLDIGNEEMQAMQRISVLAGDDDQQFAQLAKYQGLSNKLALITTLFGNVRAARGFIGLNLPSTTPGMNLYESTVAGANVPGAAERQSQLRGMAVGNQLQAVSTGLQELRRQFLLLPQTAGNFFESIQKGIHRVFEASTPDEPNQFSWVDKDAPTKIMERLRRVFVSVSISVGAFLDTPEGKAFLGDFSEFATSAGQGIGGLLQTVFGKGAPEDVKNSPFYKVGLTAYDGFREGFLSEMDGFWPGVMAHVGKFAKASFQELWARRPGGPGGAPPDQGYRNLGPMDLAVGGAATVLGMRTLGAPLKSLAGYGLSRLLLPIVSQIVGPIAGKELPLALRMIGGGILGNAGAAATGGFGRMALGGVAGSALFSIINYLGAKNNVQRGGAVVGGAGGIIGGLLGAGIGSVIAPGVGTVAGGAIGSVIGTYVANSIFSDSAKAAVGAAFKRLFDWVGTHIHDALVGFAERLGSGFGDLFVQLQKDMSPGGGGPFKAFYDIWKTLAEIPGKLFGDALDDFFKKTLPEIFINFEDWVHSPANPLPKAWNAFGESLRSAFIDGMNPLHLFSDIWNAFLEGFDKARKKGIPPGGGPGDAVGGIAPGAAGVPAGPPMTPRQEAVVGALKTTGSTALSSAFEGIPGSKLAEAALKFGAEKINLGQNFINYCEAFAEQATQDSRRFATAASAIGSAGFTKTGNQADVPIGGIVTFGANAGNAFAGHAGVKVGDDEMLSATSTGIKRSSISAWSKNIAPLAGYRMSTSPLATQALQPVTVPTITGPQTSPAVTLNVDEGAVQVHGVSDPETAASSVVDKFTSHVVDALSRIGIHTGQPAPAATTTPTPAPEPEPVAA